MADSAEQRLTELKQKTKAFVSQLRGQLEEEQRRAREAEADRGRLGADLKAARAAVAAAETAAAEAKEQTRRVVSETKEKMAKQLAFLAPARKRADEAQQTSAAQAQAAEQSRAESEAAQATAALKPHSDVGGMYERCGARHSAAS